MYSQDLGTGWSNPAGTTELVNVTTSPDGTSTADKLVEDTSSGQHYVSSSSVSWASSTTYTFSVFAKAETRYFLDLAFGTSSFWVNGHRRAVFNLARGTVHSTAGASLTALIIPYPNGWYRCSITATTVSTAVAATTCQLLITSDGTSGGSYPGDGTSGLYLWGAQTEQGAFPTSYIPTTASTVTRSADNASMTGTNFSSWYNQTEGTIVGDCSHPTLSSMICSISDGTINNRLQLETGTNTRGIRVVYNGVSTTSTLSYTYGKRQKFISSYTTNTANYANAGILATTIKISGFPTANNLRIGANVSNESQLNSSIARLTYYPRALKPNQLRYLTQ